MSAMMKILCSNRQHIHTNACMCSRLLIGLDAITCAKSDTSAVCTRGIYIGLRHEIDRGTYADLGSRLVDLGDLAQCRRLGRLALPLHEELRTVQEHVRCLFRR